MSLLETPPLLISDDEQEYIDKAREEFKNPILLPENKKVLFFYETDIDWQHLWRGKNCTQPPNKLRMQRILWVKFILANKDIRVVKQRIFDGNIVFFCKELCYLVVCQRLKRGDLKFITQYVKNANFEKEFNDPSQYQDCII